VGKETDKGAATAVAPDPEAQDEGEAQAEPTPKPKAKEAPLRLSDETLRKLAAIYNEERLHLLDAEVAQQVANARAQIVRTPQKQVEAAASAMRRRGNLSGLDREQRGEWLRCMIMRSVGRYVEPDAELDADGLITQALNPVTGSSGAYLLPDEFVADVEKKAAEPAVVWPIVTKRPTKRRTVIKPEVTSYVTPNVGTAANVNSATTATEITVTEPVFDEVQWDLEDSDARMPLKLDLIEESPINVRDELIALAADGFSLKREYGVLRGTGHANKQALGLLDSGAGITEVAISAAPTVANILTFCAQLPKRYRTVARIITGSQTLYKVAAALAQNVRAAAYLVKLLPPMDDSEHCEEGKMIIGDFSRYVVYYVRLLQIVTSLSAERKTQEIVITETWTGQPTIVDAFRIGTEVTYS